MRISRTTIAALCAALTLLLLSSCDHKELCFHHPHGADIRIVFDWRDAPDAHPEGMAVFFYPIDDDGLRAEDAEDEPTNAEYYRRDLLPGGGELYNIPVGKYRVICYNNDTDGVLFNNYSLFDTHYGYTREGSLLEPIYGNTANRAPSAPGAEGDRVVICPDEMWGCSVFDLEITETGVKYIHYPFDPDADEDVTKPVINSEHVITLYPHLLTCYYDYIIHNVENSEYIYQVCASMSGMAPGMTFGNEALDKECVSIPFGASPDAKKGTITGNFITWGHHEENAKPHQLVIYVWMKGDTRGWYFIHDVTDQVHAAPDRHHVHIEIDGLSLPKPINPTDSGFEPSVDDWVSVDFNITM